jgi:hypothetical protein
MARSILIRRQFPVGGTITVCTNPSNCFEGRYARITLKKQPITVIPKLLKDLVFPGGSYPAATIAYCVSTFEHSYEDLWVRVEYDSGARGSGLDGAVSRIGACVPGTEGNPETAENTMPYDHLDSSE